MSVHHPPVRTRYSVCAFIPMIEVQWILLVEDIRARFTMLVDNNICEVLWRDIVGRSMVDVPWNRWCRMLAHGSYIC